MSDRDTGWRAWRSGIPTRYPLRLRQGGILPVVFSGHQVYRRALQSLMAGEAAPPAQAPAAMAHENARSAIPDPACGPPIPRGLGVVRIARGRGGPCAGDVHARARATSRT